MIAYFKIPRKKLHHLGANCEFRVANCNVKMISSNTSLSTNVLSRISVT